MALRAPAAPGPLRRDGDRNRLRQTRWGLPSGAFDRPVPVKQRGALFPRDLLRQGRRLSWPDDLQRCLILLEAFAYPAGETGQVTRNWFGVSDQPLVAWAGLCTPDGAAAGILVLANALVAPVSETMPRLLVGDDQARWLEGATLLSLGPEFPDSAFYSEDFGERWSTGVLSVEDDA